MKKPLRVLALGLVLTISACAPFQLQKAGIVTIDGEISVTAGTDWNRNSNASDGEIWTVDGTPLQHMQFLTGTEDGETIFKPTGKEMLPKFKAGMTTLEIAELIHSSLTTKGYSNFEMANLRPFTLGGEDGFRFEYSCSDANGLSKQGFVVGAERNKKLFLIFYIGARLHYYEKLKNEAESIVASVKFL